MSLADNEVVWLTEWRTHGFVVSEGAYVTRVRFINPTTGEWDEDNIENDELKRWEDHALDYESE